MDTFLRSHSEDGSQLPHASFSASPIVITLVASAFATAVLLITYRVIVKKCCFPGHAHQDEDSFIALSPATWNVDHGLEGSVIRGIPTFRFRAVEAELRTGFCCCAVCLNEFREQDELRFLPNCSHSFHLDCIDIWLRSNANCPLCRTSISAGTGWYPDDRIIAPSSSPQDTEACSDSLLGGDENFVVIELRGSDSDVTPTYSKEQNQGKFKNSKRDKGSSMGDECIDLRDHNDHLCVQPLRRSFSLDSAADRRLFLTVQAAVGKNKNQCEEVSSGEGCSSSSKVRRSLFSFSNSRGSRNAIRPLNFEI